MTNWYQVIKTIKGHRYVYEQRTWRDGKHVRTESRYVGPAGSGDGRAAGEGTASVNTTPLAIVRAEDIEAALGELLKPLAEGRFWSHGWDVHSKGKNLVDSVPAADAVIRKLRPRRTRGLKGAFYRIDTDTINLPPKEYFYNAKEETATQAYYATLLHELTHWTGHRRRLDRSTGLWFGDKQYAREELVAEATAITLMLYFEMVPADLGRHAAYFQHWLVRAGNRDEALAYARREAERAARFILGVNTT